LNDVDAGRDMALARATSSSSAPGKDAPGRADVAPSSSSVPAAADGRSTDAAGATRAAPPSRDAGEPPVAGEAAASDPTGAPKPAPTAESFDALVKKGRRAQKAGRSGEAARLFKLALEQQPDDNDARLGLAWAELDRGRHGAAIDVFGAVIARDAALVEAQFGLGEALRAAGRTADAVAAYQRYLALAPEGPDAETAKNAINALQ
jgi:Flp pilus assembly protein TadD